MSQGLQKYPGGYYAVLAKSSKLESKRTAEQKHAKRQRQKAAKQAHQQAMQANNKAEQKGLPKLPSAARLQELAAQMKTIREQQEKARLQSKPNVSIGDLLEKIPQAMEKADQEAEQEFKKMKAEINARSLKLKEEFDRRGRLLGGTGGDAKSSADYAELKGESQSSVKKQTLSATLTAIEKFITKSKLSADEAVKCLKGVRENIAAQETEEGKQAAADAALFIALKLNKYRDFMWPLVTALFALFASPEYNALFFQTWQVWINWIAQQVASTIFVKLLAPRTAREAVEKFGISLELAEMYCKIFGDATLAAIIPWNMAQDGGQYVGQALLGLDSNTAAIFSSWAPGIAEVITQGATIDRRSKALDSNYEFNRSELLLSMSPIPGSLPGDRWQATFSVWMFVFNFLTQASYFTALPTAVQALLKVAMAVFVSLNVASDVRAENEWAAKVSNPAFRKFFGMEDPGEKISQTLKRLKSELATLQKEIESKNPVSSERLDSKDNTAAAAAVGTNGSINRGEDSSRTSASAAALVASASATMSSGSTAATAGSSSSVSVSIALPPAPTNDATRQVTAQLRG